MKTLNNKIKNIYIYIKQFNLTRVSILTLWFKLLNQDNSIKNKKNTIHNSQPSKYRVPTY